MFINKEGKLFGRISIIDLFVVVAIIVAAFGVYTRFFVSNEKVSVKSSTIEYQMRVKGVRSGTVEALKMGGPIYDTQTKEYMGEIISSETEAYFEEQELTDGRLVLSEVPERQTVVVTVRVDGSINDSGYYTKDNKALYVGSTFIIGSKYAETTGEISAISVVKP